MVASPILSLAPELVHRIFQGCENFADIVALASSSRTFHAVWLSQAPSLIWERAPAKFIAFDNALMAVRATRIIANAHSARTEPPLPFPVKELSGYFKKPTAEEMRAVSNFEHLAKCVERMMISWKVQTEPGQGQNVVMLLSQASWPRRYGESNEKIYRGIYNALLAGAVCSRPYNAPFFLAEAEGRTDFLERCAGAAPLREEDFEYLQKFPVYRFYDGDESDTGKWRDKEYETLFGPLAQWLIEDGARRGIEENLPPSKIPTQILDEDHPDRGEMDDENGGSFDSSQTGSIREIKILIGGYEHFHRKVSREDHSREELCSPDIFNQDFRGQREVDAVVFGLFQLERISMPFNIPDAERGVLFAKPMSGFPPPRTIDIHRILEQVRRHESNSQLLDGHPPPPPNYELFAFILRQYLNLRWIANAFDQESGYDSYLSTIDSGTIFQTPYPNEWENDSLTVYQVPLLTDEPEF